MSVEKKLSIRLKLPRVTALVAVMLAFATELPAQISVNTVDVSGIVANSPISASTVKTNFNNLRDNDTNINDQLIKLNSLQWTYASGSPATLRYQGGYLGIGTIPTYLFQVSQGTGLVPACIANLNNGNHNPNSLSDPNEALRIIGGTDGGPGGALVQFYTPNGTNRLGWIGQKTQTTVEYAITSDRRLKDGIVDTHYSLDQLLKIQVRDFFFKSDPGKKLQDGFIAQELYDVYPEAVSKPASEDGTWGVDYGRLSPIIVKSIQDQQKEIEALEQENAELKARLAAIEKKLGM
jgi:hypothetical protein